MIFKDKVIDTALEQAMCNMIRRDKIGSIFIGNPSDYKPTRQTFFRSEEYGNATIYSFSDDKKPENYENITCLSFANHLLGLEGYELLPDDKQLVDIGITDGHVWLIAAK